MSSERAMANIELVRSFVAAYSDGRIDDALRLVTDDYASEDVADQTGPVRRGKGAFGQVLQSTRAALPDVREQLVDLVADDDRVAFRIRAQGHHTGTAWLGRTPTGAQVEWECFGIWFVRDGLLSGESYLDDAAAIERSLRAEPVATEPGNG